MQTNLRTPAFLHPAGQTVGQSILNGLSTVSNALSLPPGAVGTNAQGQFVDANGMPIKDVNGNVMSAPIVSQPQVVTAKPDAATVGGMLLSVLITVAVVGGAAYAGSFYGTRRADRGRRSSRASRSA